MSQQDLEEASNADLKKIRKLQKKKERYKQNLFLIEGQRALEQLIYNQALSVRTIFFDDAERLWQHPEWENLLKEQERKKISSTTFEELSDTDNPQGVLALVELPEAVGAGHMSDQEGIVIAFDGVQDPGNVGTIIRSATWFGCDGLLVGKGTVDPFHPKVVRGTAGATGILGYCMGDLTELFAPFIEKNWDILVLDPSKDAIKLNEWKVQSRTLLVAGNEAHGIQSSIKEVASSEVKIPDHKGGANYLESLNVAVTVGISIYELTRD